MISHSANACINISGPKPLTGPNPWLSAIPRSSGLPDMTMAGTWRNKRRVEEVDADDEGYDGEESAESGRDDKSADEEKTSDGDVSMSGSGVGGAEKKAAWLLMKLSVKDGERGGDILGGTKEKESDEAPRVKRRRATSM